VTTNVKRKAEYSEFILMANSAQKKRIPCQNWSLLTYVFTPFLQDVDVDATAIILNTASIKLISSEGADAMMRTLQGYVRIGEVILAASLSRRLTWCGLQATSRRPVGLKPSSAMSVKYFKG